MLNTPLLNRQKNSGLSKNLGWKFGMVKISGFFFLGLIFLLENSLFALSTQNSLASPSAATSGPSANPSVSPTATASSTTLNNPVIEPPAQLRVPPLGLISRVDKAVINVNQSFKFEVEISVNPAHQLRPLYIGQALNQLRIIKSGEEEKPAQLDGSRRKIFWYDIEPLIEGTYLIPAITIEYTVKGDSSQNVYRSVSKGIFVQVGPDTKAVEAQASIPEPYVVEAIFWTKTKKLALLAVFILVLLGTFLWWFKKRQRHELEQAVVLSPWDQAFAELKKLEVHLVNRQLTTDRLYCFQISEILRRYLDQRYQLNTLEQTTEEIKSILRKNSFLQNQDIGALARFLERNDEVKFTSAWLGETERNTLFNFVVDYVTQTKFVEISQKTEAKGL